MKSTIPNLEPLSQWSGCLGALHGAPPALDLPGSGNLEEREWFYECLPTINQHGPSCCGQAWANWMELMIRRYVARHAIPEGFQINGYAIWKKGRDLYFSDDRGGLYLDQGFQAALDLGVLPPGSQLVQVIDVPSCVTAALKETPLVQSHYVHDGWLRPDPKNGCIAHLESGRNTLGGHATLRIGMLIRDTVIFYPYQNSWGSGWGWNGIGMMSAEHSTDTRCQNICFTARLPIGWPSWTGWRRFLTREAQ